jgi:hypothetical protein
VGVVEPFILKFEKSMLWDLWDSGINNKWECWRMLFSPYMVNYDVISLTSSLQ